MKYIDYYKTLGVGRSASDDEIRSAYRKMARQFHPDVNKAKGAEEKFKEITEAYEVLKDADKRARYDSLGQGWNTGQEFRPPPGFESAFSYGFTGGSRGPRGAGAAQHASADASSFSDFFESIFGSGFAFSAEEASSARANRDGKDLQTKISISIEEAYHGVEKNISFDLVETNRYGEKTRQKKSFKVKIPAGTADGTVIRLAGQGSAALGSGKAGDLLLTVEIAKNSRYEVNGKDITIDLPISPWEAALGAKVALDFLGIKVNLSVPAGSQTGSKLRIRSKGLQPRFGAAGDLYVRLTILIPKELTYEERELFSRLSDVSRFNPRA